MPEVQLHPYGIILAVVFVFSVGAIVWWMLHPPKAEEETPAVEAALEAGQILVGFHGAWGAEELLRLACELGRQEKAPVTAMYVTEVPFTLPLDAPIPEEDERARVAGQKARAIAAEYETDVRYVIRRGRKAGRAIVDAALHEPTRSIILGASEHLGMEDRLFGSSAEFVLRHAPCQVLVRRPARVKPARG